MLRRTFLPSSGGGGGGGAVDSVNGHTGAVTLAASDVSAQAADSDLTAIAALNAATANVIASDGSGWIAKTYAQLKTALGLTKSDVGLGNVTNNAQVTGVSAADSTITIGGTSTAPTVAVNAIAEAKVTGLTTDLAAKLASASNLSDLANAGTARTNLGLGGAAVLAVGTTTGTVAAGDDARILAAAVGLTVTAVKTSAYGAAANEFVPVDTTSGSVTVTFPTAPADKTRVAVKQVVRGGSNTVSLALGGSDVFNVAGGSTTGTLTLLNQGAIFQYKASTAIWYASSTDLALSQLDLRYPLLSTYTTKGDLVVATASGAIARHAVGTDGQVLTADSAQTDGVKWGAAGGTPDVQTFTSSGTWTKPAGATWVEVLMIGGGGGGGSGRRGAAGTVRCGGGGGAGGGRSCGVYPAASLSGTVTVTVGTAGPGGAAVTADSTSGNNGTLGNNTTFGSLLTAAGGTGGGGGTASAGSAGTGGTGEFAGGGGAAANGSGTGGASAAVTSGTGTGGTGGGAGGGITTGDAASSGGSGGRSGASPAGAVATGGSAGNAGSAGGSVTTGAPIGGNGGGGGGSSTSAAGGAGGAAGNYGSGGGGGGASVNGNNSGAGAAGADGIVVVVAR